MPELPDIHLYLERLSSRLIGQPLERVRLASPFILRTAVPPLSAAHGRTVQGFERIGKRIVFVLEGELFLVLHLMIAGRLRWREPGAAIHKKLGLLAFDFPHGSLLLTEASSKKRAALHVIAGRAALQAIDPGGIDVFGSSLADFTRALTRENHTIKRTLTDPRVLSGIGNAYSDEILHHAQLSPIRMTQKLEPGELARLHESCKVVLQLWIDELRDELGPDDFPEKVTAFREGMAVHGRYGKPCPVCGSPVQRIAYADNETNYCARCQTGGKLLADRSLSRLLRDDWPKTLTELEERAQLRVAAQPTAAAAQPTAAAAQPAAQPAAAQPMAGAVAPIAPAADGGGRTTRVVAPTVPAADGGGRTTRVVAPTAPAADGGGRTTRVVAPTAPAADGGGRTTRVVAPTAHTADGGGRTTRVVAPSAPAADSGGERTARPVARTRPAADVGTDSPSRAPKPPKRKRMRVERPESDDTDAKPPKPPKRAAPRPKTTSSATRTRPRRRS